MTLPIPHLRVFPQSTVKCRRQPHLLHLMLYICPIEASLYGGQASEARADAITFARFQSSRSTKQSG